MRVAMISRSSLFTVRGGDTTQVEKTAEALRKAGVSVEIFRAADPIPYERFDLLHFFNIIRPADHLRHIARSRKPYVVSTIYLDYSVFDRMARRQPYRSLFTLLGPSSSELLKNFYRYYKRQDRLVSMEYLLGHRRAMKKVIRGASLLLPNSHSEYRRLMEDMGIQKEYRVIPNGIDEKLFHSVPEGIERKDKVICVAQVYGMKNQHALIRACEKLDVPLDIIGKPPPNHVGYYRYCRRISGGKVRFIGHLPQEELVRHYAGAKVHALPSWFETTGLSSLEAGAMGCNLVVGTGGDTREYFGDMARYCSASDQESIAEAVAAALGAPPDPGLRDKILSDYTWGRAADETRQAYETAINNE